MSANWDGIVFDTGGPAYQRVPMSDPLKGTREMVGDIMERAGSVEALLENLGADNVEDVVDEPGW